MENEKQMPEFQLKSGKINVAVWKNTVTKDGKNSEYKTVSLSESYKKDNQWQNKTISIMANELPRLLVLLSEAQKHIVVKAGETA